MTLPLSVLIPAKEITPLLLDSLWALELCPDPVRPKQILVGLDAQEIRGEQCRLAEVLPDRVELLSLGSERPVGPATIRNRLASRASGEHLLFVDSDVCLNFRAMESIAQHLPLLADPYLFTVTIRPEVENWVASFFNNQVMVPRNVRGRSYFPSAVWGMSKSTFFLSGGFDEDFAIAGGEDWDWLARVYHQLPDLMACLIRDAVVTHQNPVSLSELFGRAVRYGSQAPLYHRKFVPEPWPLRYRLAQKLLTKYLIPLNRQVVRWERALIRRGLLPRPEPLETIKNTVLRVWRVTRRKNPPPTGQKHDFLLSERVLFRLEKRFIDSTSGSRAPSQPAQNPLSAPITILDNGASRPGQIAPGEALVGSPRAPRDLFLGELWDFSHNASAFFSALLGASGNGAPKVSAPQSISRS